MYRTLGDIEGRYVVVPPEEGVSLADIHNVPYPAPDYAVLEDGSRIPRIVVRPWSDEYPDTLANAGGFSPADMRPLAPMPVASPDGALPGAGISLADLVRTISPAADSEAWRGQSRAVLDARRRARAYGWPVVRRLGQDNRSGAQSGYLALRQQRSTVRGRGRR